MLNTIHLTWVKNVNNLFTSSWVQGVTLSSFIKKSIQGIGTFSAQHRFTRLTFHLNQSALSTRIIYIFSLLKNSYTHNPQGLLLKQLQKN
jgi:hypothetical protein